MKRILWALTGSGDKINEIFDTMQRIRKTLDVKIRVVTSKAAEQVLRWYKLWDQLHKEFKQVQTEKSANEPFIAGPLQAGKYDLLIVAPLTANSAAKISHGIADSLVTNAVAQTLKGKTPVVVYPVDQRTIPLTTITPAGDRMDLQPRQIDVDNVEHIRKMPRVQVIPSPENLYDIVSGLINEKESEVSS